MDEVRIYRDYESLSDEAGRLVLEEIRVLLRGNGHGTVILAGGSTPRGCYAWLAQAIAAGELPLERLTWLLGDERWVPPGHPGSNEAMARQVLLDPAGIPPERVLSWDAGSGEPVQAAARFERRLRQHFGLKDAAPLPEAARSLLLVGLGSDGHTASLFPDAEGVLPDGRRVPVSPDLPGLAAAIYRPAGRIWRLTLTPRLLRGAGCILFLVSGAEKREALREVLNGNPALPGSWLNLRQTTFLVTRDTVEAVRL